jgi:hypothetical protein
MKVYLIYAYEASYNGLHGIYDWDVVSCDNEEEVQGIGRQMSESVIESYASLQEELENDVLIRLSEEGINPNDLDYEERYDDWYDCLLNEQIQYEYWELDPSVDYHEIIDQNTDWEELRDKYSIDNKGE